MRYPILLYIGLMLGLASLLSAFPAKSDEPIIQWQLTQFWPHTRYSSLWNALPHSFELNHHVNEKAVRKQIKFLSRRQDYINELAENARPYLYFVYSQTEKNHMPAEIALVPMIESDYNPFGISRTGATGLWQMMPGTASSLGLKIDWWHDGRRNVINSTKAALAHLRYLHSYFGSWLLALAAYDSGDGTVRAAIRYNKKHGLPTDFWHLHLPKETKRYVPKLLALAAVISNRNHYGLQLEEIPNHPYFTAIKMKGQIALNKIAKLSDTALELVRKLNPDFRRWSTLPKKNYWLVLPSAKAEIFRHNLTKTKDIKTEWINHRVKSGETLSTIAAANQTTTRTIEEINHLDNKPIRVGQHLRIPKIETHVVSSLTKHNRITEDKKPGPRRYVHTVKANDSLSSIAAKYHVKASQIRHWNNLGYFESLKPNEKLTIWTKHTDLNPGSHTYTVQKNDSLSRIGQKFQTTATQIKLLNNLKTNVLQIGQSLKIPYPNIHHKTYTGKHTKKVITHTVRSGQSLSMIAHYYHVSTRDIVGWNKLQKQKYLHVGEQLKIHLY